MEKWDPASVEEGAQEYVADIDIRDAGDRALTITLNGASMRIDVDGKTAAEDIRVENVSEGQLGFACRWGGFGWSQRNLADDVYDGVFEKLLVQTLPDGEGHTQVLYDDLLHGLDKVVDAVSGVWRSVVNWFIKNL